MSLYAVCRRSRWRVARPVKLDQLVSQIVFIGERRRKPARGPTRTSAGFAPKKFGLEARAPLRW